MSIRGTMSGQVPKPLGLTSVSGLVVGLRVPRIYGAIPIKIARRAKDLLKLALRKSGSRLTGKILIKSKAWDKAFLHIAGHFSLAQVTEKAVQTVFVSGLRNRAALEALIVKAVKSPSHKFLSRAKVHGVNAGRPVVMLEREFSDVIGETFIKDASGQIKKLKDCKFLRVIIDVTGRPITAYPIEALKAGL